MASLSVERLQRVFINFPLSAWQVGGIALGSYAVYWLGWGIKVMVWEPWRSPLRELPGPENVDSYIWGNFPAIMKTEDFGAEEGWFKKYGPTIQVRAPFMRRVLCTKDPRALSHILNNGYDFPKPLDMRKGLGLLFGDGLLIVEGDDHRRQRRIMNPAFSNAQIREMVPAFYEKAFKLRDIWYQEVQSGEGDIDVLLWLNRATLDIIGQVGFDYDFDSLTEGTKNELNEAFTNMFKPNQKLPLLAIILHFVPILRFVVKSERGRLIEHSRDVMRRVGAKLVAEKKASIVAASGKEGSLDKKTVIGKDILSVTLKANLASDVKDTERLSDKEVIDQIGTMLIAGHETTASSLSWLLYTLAKPEHHAIQAKLRAELQSVKTDQPSMEELNSLKYLDAVVRENSRVNAVVDGTTRSAGADAVIPVSKPYVDRKGVLRNEIHIKKGEDITIPIQSINRDTEIWGEDAWEFKPERWLNSEKHPYNADVPGVYSGLLTFLAGPRACIGWRLALVELKVLIFALLRNISVDLPDERLSIEKRGFIVVRPSVPEKDGKFKTMMPLKLKIVGSS